MLYAMPNPFLWNKMFKAYKNVATLKSMCAALLVTQR
jgi:hypothetical protein